MNKNGISAVLLAYGEEENLRTLLPRVRMNLDHLGEPYEVIVVDALIPVDNTKTVCDENGARYINQEEPAFAGAFRTAIRHASFDKFLIMDADCSHDPDVIPAIYKKFIEGHDVVIGSRYTQGGSTEDSPVSVLLSRILNAVFRFYLGIDAHDISTDFRMYDTQQLKNTSTRCVNYDVLQEVLVQLKLNKPTLSIAEVPISFHRRHSGHSKRKPIQFIWSYIKSLFNLTLLRLAKTYEKQELYKNIFLYIVFGLLAAMLEYIVFVLLINTILPKTPEIANIIGNACGFAFAFYTNTYFNFKKKGKLLKRLLSYGLINLIGLALSTLAINLLKPIVNIYFLKAILLMTIAIMQFMLNKFITYRT